MKRGPKDRERERSEAGFLREEQPTGVSDEAGDERTKDAEDAEWTSMVGGDPALFIKGSE